MEEELIAQRQYNMIIGFAKVFTDEKDPSQALAIRWLFNCYIESQVNHCNRTLLLNKLNQKLSEIELIENITPGEEKNILKDNTKEFCEYAIHEIESVIKTAGK